MPARMPARCEEVRESGSMKFGLSSSASTEVRRAERSDGAMNQGEICVTRVGESATRSCGEGVTEGRATQPPSLRSNLSCVRTQRRFPQWYPEQFLPSATRVLLPDESPPSPGRRSAVPSAPHLPPTRRTHGLSLVLSFNLFLVRWWSLRRRDDGERRRGTGGSKQRRTHCASTPTATRDQQRPPRNSTTHSGGTSSQFLSQRRQPARTNEERSGSAVSAQAFSARQGQVPRAIR